MSDVSKDPSLVNSNNHDYSSEDGWYFIIKVVISKNMISSSKYI